MEKEEIFDRIYKDIKKYQKEGRIIKVFSDNSVRVVDIESFCQQSVEGLLYDLGLEEAYLSAFYHDDPLRFADLMAISSVIRFLRDKQKPKE